MFAHAYQGGECVEIFSPTGSQPLAQWKVSTKGVKREYDKSTKGNVYSISGGPGYKLQLPKDERKALALVQPVLVLQVFLQPSQPFSFEVSFTDTGGTRRRLVFSKAFSDVKETPLHCQLPLSSVPDGCWTNLALDLPSLLHAHFRGVTLRSTDMLALGSSCKLRKVFTLRDSPTGCASNALSIVDPIPRSVAFPPQLSNATTVVLDASNTCSVNDRPVSEGFTPEHVQSGSVHATKRTRPISEPPASRKKQPHAPVAFGTTLSSAGGGIHRRCSHGSDISGSRAPPEEARSTRVLSHTSASPSASPGRQDRHTRHQSATLHSASRAVSDGNFSLSSSLRSNSVVPSQGRGRYDDNFSEDEGGDEADRIHDTRYARLQTSLPERNRSIHGAVPSRRRQLSLDNAQMSEPHVTSKGTVSNGQLQREDPSGSYSPFKSPKHSEEPVHAIESPGRASNYEPYANVSDEAPAPGRCESPRWPGDCQNYDSLQGLLSPRRGQTDVEATRNDVDEFIDNNQKLQAFDDEEVELHREKRAYAPEDVDADSLESLEQTGYEDNDDDGFVEAEALNDERIVFHRNGESMQLEGDDEFVRQRDSCPANEDDEDDARSTASEALPTPEGNQNNERLYTPPIIPASRVAESPVNRKDAASHTHLRQGGSAHNAEVATSEHEQQLDCRNFSESQPMGKQTEQPETSTHSPARSSRGGASDMSESSNSSTVQARRMERTPPSAKRMSSRYVSNGDEMSAPRSEAEAVHERPAGDAEAVSEQESANADGTAQESGGLLDLIYDPILGLYFDPSDLRYYELK